MRPHRDTADRARWPLLPVAGLVLAGLSACSPGLDWRVLPLGAVGAEVMMPCKPESASRELMWAGQPQRLNMRSCEQQGVTFAVAWMSFARTDQAVAAVAEWRAASQRSAQVQGAAEPQAWAVPGALMAQRWQGGGQREGGPALNVTLGHAVFGAHVVQLATYAPAESTLSLSTFWEGLAKSRR